MTDKQNTTTTDSPGRGDASSIPPAGTFLHGFDILRVFPLAEQQSTGIHARHRVTGCEVFHLYNDDTENLFAYSFMTPPEDSTGVAHILEHSVLCGSRRYPLKDPFLVLAKQSVKTFLNAMTFPDKTVYPASSIVEADYFNLMSVYGDAVFFPRLDEWVFKQEGHRFELGANGEMTIQGVVFNEMRGNYSSFDSVAADWSLRSILADSCYDHDSGGDPSFIPELTYEQFIDFHKRWYHPVNCRIFLYGNIETARQLELLEERFLKEFAPALALSPIAPIAPFSAPRTLEVTGPAAPGQDTGKATVQVNWLLGPSSDPVDLMEANLAAELLMGHDASPLSRALMESGLGEDLSPSSGLETEIKYLCFSTGLRGVARANAHKVESLVLDTIATLAETGIGQIELETALRSIEFSNREVRRSGGPFSLSLMRRSLRGWLHGYNPEFALAYTAAFETVRSRAHADPRYVCNLLHRFFIDNQHRATVQVYPSAEYEKGLEDKLEERCSRFESSLDQSTRRTFLDAQQQFFDLQAEPDPEHLLSLIPHIAHEDLPAVPDSIPSELSFVDGVPLILHEQGTNGIVYLDIALPVDVLAPEDYPLLPLFSSALTAMALDGISWQEASALSARWTGGLAAMLFTSTPAEPLAESHTVSEKNGLPGLTLDRTLVGRDWMIIRVKALAELSEQAFALAFRFLDQADFSDPKRLMDIMLEYRNDLDSSVAPAGNQYAVSRAGAFAGRSRAIDELWNGLTQLDYIRTLSAECRDSRRMNDLARRLSGIRERLLTAGMLLNLTADSVSRSTAVTALASIAAGRSGPAAPSAHDTQAFFALASRISGAKVGSSAERDTKKASLELVSASIQVGFAAAVLPGLPYGEPDQPVDTVFGHWLASGPLWERIRTTGGAYGAFAYPDSLEDIFILATYRDPDPVNSLEVFRTALEQAAQTRLDKQTLDRTITGCYSRELQPRSPADKGFTALVRLLYGISDAHRRRKIARILSVTPEDMAACASRLSGHWSGVSMAVLGGKKQIKAAKKYEFTGEVQRYTV